MFLFLESL